MKTQQETLVVGGTGKTGRRVAQRLSARGLQVRVTSRSGAQPFDWDDLANSVAYYRSLESGTTRLPEFSARHRRVWLVLSHEYDSTFDGDTSEAVRRWFSRNGYAARLRSFQNIQVRLYERRP